MHTKPKLTHTLDIAKKAPLLVSLSLVAFHPAASGAVITPVTYDFGTGTGKTTFGDAGFTVPATGTGQATNLADSVLLDKSDKTTTGFHNVGLLKAFTGLGGGETNNFTVTTSFTLSTFEVTNANNERIGGIHLFADAATAAGLDTGITLQLHGLIGTGTDNDSFRMTTGVGGIVFQTTSLGYDFAQGDIFDLTAVGTFTGTTLNLLFSVSRNGGAAQAINRNFNTVTDAALLDGTFSGASMRMKTTTASSFDTFSVIPEPSSTMMVGLFGGISLLFRRRGLQKS